MDDSLPTDVVIGDPSNDPNKFQSFPQSSAMSNGCEMQAPYYSQDATRPPYSNQFDTNLTSQFEEEDLNDSQSWGEWDDGSLGTKDQQSPQVPPPTDQNCKGEIHNFPFIANDTAPYFQLVLCRTLVYCKKLFCSWAVFISNFSNLCVSDVHMQSST